MMNNPPELLLEPETAYRSLYTIRRFEETVLANFARGVFFGTTHTYLGQEANAVGVISQISPGDILFSNHRCHGHFIAYGGSPHALFAELMGKESGVCAGRGGSQHLHWRNFYSNGVQGGIVPIATGMALAEKFKRSQAVTLAFLGDGTLGEGVVYEALNMASLWGAPILFVLENNRIAQTTPIELAVSGSIPGRFQAFDIPASELESADVQVIAAHAQQLIQVVRRTSRPQALILHTQRFGPHSKGDDTRSPEEIERLRAGRDPLPIVSDQLSTPARAAIEQQVDESLAKAYQQALDDPYPAFSPPVLP